MVTPETNNNPNFESNNLQASIAATQGNSIQPVVASSGASFLTKFFLFTGIVIVLGVVGIYFTNKNSFKKTLPGIQTTNKVVPNLTQTENALSLKATIDSPVVSDSATITIESVPKEIHAFILPDISNLLIKANTYKNGKTGFTITYNTSIYTLSDLTKIYYLSINNSKNSWKSIEALRADLAAYLEAENPKYQMKIQESLADPQKPKELQVKISIIAK